MVKKKNVNGTKKTQLTFLNKYVSLHNIIMVNKYELFII